MNIQPKSSGFLAIPLIIVGLLLLLVVGGGSYYLGQRQVVQQRASEPINTPTVPEPTPTVLQPSPTTQIPTPTHVPLPTVSPRESISRAFSDRSFDILRPLMADNIHHTIWATECCQDSGIDTALTFISGKVNASTATWIFDQSDGTIARIRSSDRSYEPSYIGLASNGQVFIFFFNDRNQINGVMYTRDYHLVTN